MNSKTDNNFKWWFAIIGYMSYILAFLMNSWFMTVSESWFESDTFNSGALYNASMFIVGGVICLSLLRLFSKSSISQFEFGLHFNNIGRAILIGSIWGFLFFGLSEFVEFIFDDLKEAGEQVMNSFSIGQNFTNDIILLLNIGLCAPVAEEIIFRGAIFNPIFQYLKKRTSLPEWVILSFGLGVSALLFAYSHGGGGQDAQLLLLGLLGILAGLGMYITNSLYGAIFVHAVNNNVVFLYTIYKMPNLDSTYSIKFMLASIVCLILCLPLGALFGKILPQHTMN